MKICAFVQKGINKKECEDRVIIGKSIISEGVFYTEINRGILAVADGVGGNNAGAEASHFVANSICIMEDISLESFKNINLNLLKLSNKEKKLNGMATTLSGVFIDDDKTKLFSIGNTRVYLLQSGKYLKQLTNDDTTLNYLLSTRQLSLDEIEMFDKKNEITACFGGGLQELFKIKVSDINKINTPFMLTSDGIHDYVSIDQIEGIIEEFGISVKTCKEMSNIARKLGSCDDISIVLGEV